MFWVIGGQALAVSGSLVGLRWLTHLLTPDSYGRLALALTAATLAQQLLLSPLSGATLRFYAAAKDVGEVGPYLAAARRLFVAGVAGVAVIYLAAAIFVGVERIGWLVLGSMALCFACVGGASSVISSVHQAARQRAVVAVFDGLSQWARFLAAVGCILVLGASAENALYGFVIGAVIVFLLQWQRFKRTIGREPSVGETSRPRIAFWQTSLVRYGWPFALWGSFTWVQVASERWALEWYGSSEVVGLLAALTQVGAYPVTMAAGLGNQLILPILFKRAGDGSDPSRTANANRINTYLVGTVLLLTAGSAAVGFVLHDEIFRTFLGPGFQQASPYLPWVIVAAGLFAAGQARALVLMTTTRTTALLMPKIGVAVLATVLNILGARVAGLAGVVYATVVTASVYLCWMLLLTAPTQATVKADQ